MHVFYWTHAYRPSDRIIICKLGSREKGIFIALSSSFKLITIMLIYLAASFILLLPIGLGHKRLSLMFFPSNTRSESSNEHK